MKHICVYCGSRAGARAEFMQEAYTLGEQLAERGIGLVYGGARVGLMGAVADGALAKGGEVIGVLPRALFETEVAHSGLTKLYETRNMHERKAMMAELSDGFIALPGGYGTFDELFEMITWAQLGIHNKPLGLLNTAKFYTPLLALITHAMEEGFISSYHASMLLVKERSTDLLDAMYEAVPRAPVSKFSDDMPVEP
ncbi:TIGR00730 family Rossman fold protein [Ktedonospora formicarum]|uniref:Cytokinin riboside 5'-monophosphate phosphoribohydrolase n=1 Tax=Ktedonospora formicarum TaxID=2778364 RepID=A0A8J3HTZ4_9CHLR|nr:TIGR00730 family Rossman fold protein [Ktedonospora formicarum]GHO43236.1 cytokinin riboside 5'-monophosphate phosphoribohydrolase [Ktedonospora formicarum]